MAGGLKRELKTKYGISPEMRHRYHELEVLVNGRSVFCYSTAHSIPTVQSLLHLVEEAAETGRANTVQQKTGTS